MATDSKLRERVAAIEREMRAESNAKADAAVALKGQRRVRTFWLTIGEGLALKQAADMLSAALGEEEGK